VRKCVDVAEDNDDDEYDDDDDNDYDYDYDNNNNNNRTTLTIVFLVLFMRCSVNLTASFGCKIFCPSQSGSFHVISLCLLLETANADRKSHDSECVAERNCMSLCLTTLSAEIRNEYEVEWRITGRIFSSYISL
jgi:hypothetical protein